MNPIKTKDKVKYTKLAQKQIPLSTHNLVMVVEDVQDEHVLVEGKWCHHEHLSKVTEPTIKLSKA